MTLSVNLLSVKPKSSDRKLTSAKKSLKVKLTKKTSQVSSHEIQYFTFKKFKSAKKLTSKKAKTTSPQRS